MRAACRSPHCGAAGTHHRKGRRARRAVRRTPCSGLQQPKRDRAWEGLLEECAGEAIMPPERPRNEQATSKFLEICVFVERTPDRPEVHSAQGGEGSRVNVPPRAPLVLEPRSKSDSMADDSGRSRRWTSPCSRRRVVLRKNFRSRSLRYRTTRGGRSDPLTDTERQSPGAEIASTRVRVPSGRSATTASSCSVSVVPARYGRRRSSRR